jgi:hypothetical protein
MATAEERYKQLIEDYKHVFNSDAGKRVLEDLASASGFQMPVFDEKEDSSGRQMAYRDGRRSIVARIQWMLELSREQFQQKAREAYAQTEADEEDE